MRELKIRPTDPGYETPQARRCPWLAVTERDKGRAFRTHSAALRYAVGDPPRLSAPVSQTSGFAEALERLQAALGVDRATAKMIVLRAVYGDPNAKVLLTVAGEEL